MIWVLGTEFLFVPFRRCFQNPVSTLNRMQIRRQMQLKLESRLMTARRHFMNVFIRLALAVALSGLAGAALAQKPPVTPEPGTLCGLQRRRVASDSSTHRAPPTPRFSCSVRLRNISEAVKRFRQKPLKIQGKNFLEFFTLKSVFNPRQSSANSY
ncbi:MAG: hypothetical protein Q7K20_06240 [Polaromonas sp.]|nr:hypothetical protein [Polaromonas sp.]